LEEVIDGNEGTLNNDKKRTAISEFNLMKGLSLTTKSLRKLIAEQKLGGSFSKVSNFGKGWSKK
tara:strand:- start:99 stop:290 length:192 start_codon:yes stop_codon:yes gene_type:complete